MKVHVSVVKSLVEPHLVNSLNGRKLEWKQVDWMGGFYENY